MTPEDSALSDPPQRVQKKERSFVFEQHPRRRVALRLAYHGHVHDGLAIQKETANTVEGLLCDSLRRLRLVPESGPQQMARCGRTDKGVSALSNCMSFIARSSCSEEDEPQLPPIDYCTKLNRILPSTIRVVGFAHVPSDFDARFSCRARTYRYYFSHRGLHLEAMQEAVKYLLGTHNFRNFCVLDVVNVSNFERTVETANICPSEALPECVSYLELKANSFLYHQVRCTMEVLLLVGRQLEPPTVVRDLLDCGDRKPQYGLADSTPLVLWECHFDDQLQWRMTRKGFQEVQSQLQDIATALMLRVCAASAMQQQLLEWYRGATDCLAPAPSGSGACDADAFVVPTTGEGSSGGEEAMMDGWSAVGCDWTQPRSDDLRKARQSDFIREMRRRTGMGGKQTLPRTAPPKRDSEEAEASSSTPAMAAVRAQRRAVMGYVPLLDRPVERTFEEQVQQLSGHKRARFDHNMLLKEAWKQQQSTAKEN